MKIVSFNVNGLRARLHQLKAVIDKYDPDIIGLQEIKVQDDDFPVESIKELGYHPEFFGQKTHYGVALLSKSEPVEIIKGFPDDEADAQRRFIMGTYKFGRQNINILNGYYPQGESRDHPQKFPAKAKYYRDITNYISDVFNSKDKFAVIGDMNIAPTDKDIGIGEDNAKRWLKTGKCSFLPEEREWMEKLLKLGLTDTFRELYPDKDDLFSWFDYRSFGFQKDPKRGLRIDLVLASDDLMKYCTSAGIDYEIRGMEKPSDHCPVWSEFDMKI